MSEPSVESFEDEFRANEYDKYWFRVTITYKSFSMIKLAALDTWKMEFRYGEVNVVNLTLSRENMFPRNTVFNILLTFTFYFLLFTMQN